MRRYISNSERMTFACQHKWWLRYRLGLAPKQQDDKAQSFGTLWHEVMEHYGLGSGDLGVVLKLDLDLDTRLRLADLLARYDAFWKGFDGATLVSSEAVYSAPCRAPGTGNPSPVTGFRGKLDKLIRMPDGRLWVVDHKTTSTDLDNWRARNAYKPQGLSYCWLVWQATGELPAGVIYDVVLTKQPLSYTQLPTVGNGTRMKSYGKGLPNTTSTNWRLAIEYHEMQWTDAHTNVFERLRQREANGYWFRRYVVPHTRQDIERTGHEIYEMATQIRRAHDRGREGKDWLDRNVGSVPGHLGNRPKASMIARLVEREGHKHPRSPGQCYDFNRPCPYMDICKHRSVEAAAHLEITDPNERYSQ